VEQSGCARVPSFGETDIPRKPNYDFERRERERTKAAESAKKAQAKADKRSGQEAPETDEAGGS
jgi:Uri superfamily endonuclease